MGEHPLAYIPHSLSKRFGAPNEFENTLYLAPGTKLLCIFRNSVVIHSQFSKVRRPFDFPLNLMTHRYIYLVKRKRSICTIPLSFSLHISLILGLASSNLLCFSSFGMLPRLFPVLSFLLAPSLELSLLRFWNVEIASFRNFRDC